VTYEGHQANGRMFQTNRHRAQNQIVDGEVYFGWSYRMKLNWWLLEGNGIEIQTERKINMQNNTIRLHRVLRATPEKIYKGILDPDAWPMASAERIHRKCTR